MRKCLFIYAFFWSFYSDELNLISKMHKCAIEGKRSSFWFKNTQLKAKGSFLCVKKAIGISFL
jgi:hypothetical protein